MWKGNMGRPWCVLWRSVRKDIEQKVHLLLYQCTDRKWSSILQWSMHRQEAEVQLQNSNANRALQSALQQIKTKKLMVDNHLHAISSMASDTSRLSKIIMDELGAEMSLAKTGGRAHSWMASICNTRTPARRWSAVWEVSNSFCRRGQYLKSSEYG